MLYTRKSIAVHTKIHCNLLRGGPLSTNREPALSKIHCNFPDYRRQKTLDEEHPHTLKIVHDLGWVYMRQGRLGEAAKLQERCLKVRIRVLSEEHPDTLNRADWE